MRVLFMGTASFACPALSALIESEHEIVGVVTQPDRPKGRGLTLSLSPVKELAQKGNLTVLQPLTLKDEAVQVEILNMHSDLVVVAAYGKILPGWVFKDIKFGAINIHGSILPKYRGAAPIERAIMADERETGVTIIKMDEGIDTGDLLLQRTIPIGEDENAGQVGEKLARLGAEMLIQVIYGIEKGIVIGQKQVGQATYAEKLDKKEGAIGWSDDAAAIHNKIRALNPHPGAHTFYQGKRIKVWLSRVTQAEKAGNVGAIIDSGEEGLVISCGRGALTVIEVQPENKRRMNAAEFVRGYRLKVGDKLE